MVIELIAVGTFVFVLLCELWHARRMTRLGHLAFGPGSGGRPRAWVRALPFARAGAAAVLVWGLAVLLDLPPKFAGNEAVVDAPAEHHLVVVLDVSPSMHLKDGGPKGDQTRAERARTLLRSILDRTDTVHTRVSVVAFYSDAKPVVVDTYDLNVLHNILDDLPLEHAFKAGKTNLYKGVELAFDLARPWREKSTTVVVASDGDTLPPSGRPLQPPSVASVLVLGVGNPHKGLFIDGHSSRQDRTSLNRLALQLSGQYHDGNTRHVPSSLLNEFARSLSPRAAASLGTRALALYAVGIGSVLLALCSPLLALFGVRGRAGRRGGRASARRGRNPLPVTG